MKLSFSAVYIFTALVALTSAAPVPIPAAHCKRIDIRRNIADLTTAQRDTFFSAIQKLKDTPDPNDGSDASIYDKYVKIHTDYVDQGHGNAQFIPWHRVFIRQFELELQSVEPSVVLPYWDWSISSQAPERSIVFTNDYLGGNGDSGSGCVTSGRFANWQTRYPSKGCLQRRFDGGNKIGAFTAPELLNQMIYETNSYADFESQLEYGIHSRVHVGVGGTMGQMWSASDPLFYLHHANVDRLWSMYQGRGEKQATEYNGQGPSKRAVSLDDVLVPFNKTVREAMEMVNNLCYTYTQQDIPTPGDQSTPTPSVIVDVPTVTPTIPQSSTTPATSTPIITTTPATTPNATQVQEPEITPVTTPLPEATPIVMSTVPDQNPETTTVTETTTTATPIPETTTVAETTTTGAPITETTTVTETTTTGTPIPETTAATEAPTTPTPATPESTLVTGTTPIVSATPVATAQPTNTSQPPNSSGTVDPYDRSNMGKIRMPVRIPETWLIMNRLSLDKYAAHEATLLQLVKQYNSRSVSSVASLQYYKDVPTCDVISDKVFQAYGVPVPNKKILHLTAPIGKVRYLSADGVTGSDGGSHVNPRNLPVADLTASDGSTNSVGSNPTTSSATTLAPAIPLVGLIAAAVLFHW